MLTEFSFEGKNVRFVGTYENPLWIHKDVCDALDIVNSQDVLSRVDDDDYTSVTVDIYYQVTTKKGTQTRKRKGKMTAVNESGLYATIFQSEKEKARAFKKWVTSVVLPEIRKTGSYNGNKTIPIAIDPSRHAIYRPLEDGKVKWQKRFTDELFNLFYLLDNRINTEPHHQHPLYFSKLIIKYIYNQMITTAENRGCTAVISELKLLRKEHEHNGVRGIAKLHQVLSDDGIKILEHTITEVAQIIRTAIFMNHSPHGRREWIACFLQEKHGQTTLPIMGYCVQQLNQLSQAI